MSKFKFLEGNLPKSNQISQASVELNEFAEACRARPGVWAEYPRPLAASSRSHIGYFIRNADSRAPKAFQGGGFDASVRAGVLYVRFIGGES